MRDVDEHRPVMKQSGQANPNPQGKAALPHLGELQAWRGAEVALARPEQIVLDYLCSLLVLSADFSFKPVRDTTYHLYWREGRWSLSLIAPGEWRPVRWNDYAASCNLQPDATWRITPAPQLAEHPHILEALQAFEQAFRERLTAAPSVAEDLPHYERSLPYYRRVLASGLASSLSQSLHCLGLERDSGRQLLDSLSSQPALPVDATR